ncbi:MAG TPA: hypothetical protein VMM27_14375 [Casimicrobiaceae bacterium]|nr:hypothetical protein [Casimicrobiaceae bacterium]
MPEYLHPGVYVEEMTTTAHSIPGVDAHTPINAERLQALVSVLRELGIASRPDLNEGVTLVELFIWLAEQVSCRAGALPEPLRQSASRALAALSAPTLAHEKQDAPLLRPDFFPGMLLDAAALSAEQEYHREKLRRHNLVAHGFGILEGLGVRVEASPAGDRVIVSPGHAIDLCGEMLALRQSVEFATPQSGSETFVALRHWEHPSATQPGNAPRGWIEEACLLSLRAQVPCPWLVLARLACDDRTWCVDPTFDAPRARSTKLQPPG